MHLLVATHDLYPDPGSGGTGRYVFETGRRLAERGHRVSVITRRRGDVPERDAVEGMDVYRYDVTVAGESAGTVLPQLPAAVRTVAEFVTEAEEPSPVDVVGLQGPVTSPLVHLAVDRDVPRVCTFHSPWPTEYRIRAGHEGELGAARRRFNALVRRTVESRVLGASDDVLALSEFMAGRLRAVYGDRFDPTVVPGGVDVDRYRPDAGTFEPIADEGGVSFLTVRRLSPRMGHSALLRAFARVTGTHPNARLFVAGDGPLREELETEAEGLGVADRVTFLGYVPDEDLPAAYASADAFVLPTQRLEGFGLATLEALSSGTPTVGTPVGATPEVLSGYERLADVDAPLLTDDADPSALAAAMSAWADLPADRRASAGRACRRFTERQFTWDRVVDRLESTYASHVEGERAGRSQERLGGPVESTAPGRTGF